MAAIDCLVGSLEVLGWSKEARRPPTRRLSVLPSIMSSVRTLGTPVEVSVLILVSIRGLPELVSGVRQPSMMFQ